MSASTLTSDTDKPGRDKPTARIAATPFNDPKADLIIRSSDNIHFYVHKPLLSIFSPVLEGMLALPDDAPQESYDNRPCIPFSDDGLHIFSLLSWCDPRCKRPRPSLSNLTMTLEMAAKYDVDPIFAHAREDLILLAPDFVKSQPLKAFAVAIRFRLDKVAQQAARATLGGPLASYRSRYLKYISAPALQNLHNYYFECQTAVRAFLASDSWAEAMKSAARTLMPEASKLHTHGPDYFLIKWLPLKATGGVFWLPTEHTAYWWSSYVGLVINMLNDCPSGSCVPRVSKFEWIQKAISLEKCSRCRKYGCERLDKVSIDLASKIEEVVSKIPFVVEY